MVDGNSPFRRAEWNDLIGQVNDAITNPPEGTDCEALPAIDLVPENHIWTVQDVEEVREALQQTCPDITFEEPLILWKVQTYEEIENAIDQAWCNCENECCEACPNAGSSSTTFLTSVNVTECTTDGIDCVSNGGNILLTAFGDYATEESNYDSTITQLCVARDVLADLQEDLANATDPEAIAQIDADIQAQEDEIAQLESDAAGYRAAMIAEAANTMAVAISLIQNSYDSCSTLVSSGPAWPFEECGPNPECCGDVPSDCKVTWSLQRRDTFFFSGGGVFVGSYNTIMTGGYTIDGSPYARTVTGNCCAIPAFACVSTTCNNPCATSQTYDFQLVESPPPAVSPTACGGGPCA